MAMQTPQERYLLDLAADAPQDHPIQQVLTSPFRGNQRLAYVRLHSAGTKFSEISTLAQLIEESSIAARNGHRSACIIENVSPEFISGLGVAWQLPRNFFIQHATNSAGSSLWDDIMGGLARERVWDLTTADADEARQRTIPSRRSMSHSHIEGLFEHVEHIDQIPARYRFRRRYERHPHYGWQINTRISYHRVSEHLCRYDHSRTRSLLTS